MTTKKRKNFTKLKTKNERVICKLAGHCFKRIDLWPKSNLPGMWMDFVESGAELL